MTVSVAKTYVEHNKKYEWLIGNARLVRYSGLLLGAHLAHAALIVLWAGSTTLSELQRLQLGVPLGEQHMTVLPHIATLGFGVGPGGTIVDAYPYLVIAALHLVSSAVLAAGGLYHIVKGPADLSKGSGRSKMFHINWQDPRRLGLILGHHLLFLGLGAIALYWKATDGGGLYDGVSHMVRVVRQPTVNPVVIFGYLAGQTPTGYSQWGLAAVDNLEDIVGGHLWIGIVLLAGGIWHILVPMLPWARRVLQVSGEALLSYSLGGLAFMGFLSAAFASHNSLAYPTELYGDDTLGLANGQLLVATIALVGHLWHTYRVRSGELLEQVYAEWNWQMMIPVPRPVIAEEPIVVVAIKTESGINADVDTSESKSKSERSA